jgi:hypothetical protein
MSYYILGRRFKSSIEKIAQNPKAKRTSKKERSWNLHKK